MKGIEQGNAALKRLNEMMPVEKVEALMDDTAENIAAQEEISQLLSGELAQADEDDCEAELAGLLELDAQQAALDLPAAPTAAPADVDVQVEAPAPAAAAPAAAAATPARVAVPA